MSVGASETSTVTVLNSVLAEADSSENSKSSAPVFDSVFIGGNCGDTNIFFSHVAVLSPYPIIAGGNAKITEHGHFLQDLHIQKYIIGTYFGDVSNYVEITMEQDVKADTEYDIASDIIFPTDPGSYLVNMQLVAEDSISCWQFSFSI